MLIAQATSTETVTVWTVISGMAAMLMVNIGKWLADSNRTKQESEVNRLRHETEMEQNRNKQILFQRMADSNDKIVEKLAEIKTGQSAVCKANCGMVSMTVNTQPQKSNETTT